MPIIDHKQAPETPWRPGYRRWELAGPKQGMACELTMGLAEPGTGAPLHVHEADELIVVLEGRLEAKVGDAVQVAGPDHTVAVPSGTPHTFKVVGDRPARILIFFPHPHPFKHTTYLEGTRPAGV